MLSMMQSARILSIYAADTAGVCSMMFELGGMTVVHDASGCNSTYSTHDEPRWYDSDSLVFVSGLTEIDAVLGNDERFIDDVVNAAKELSPKFITICGSPMPMMTGTDFDALAREIEIRSGIPTLGMHTDGMHSYILGASEALTAFVKRFCKAPEKTKREKVSVNIIGATPIDFSVNGSVDSMKQWLKDGGFDMVSCMAMGSTFEEITNAADADVNLVVSECGIETAKFFYTEYGTPYVVGVPIGKKFADVLFNDIKTAAECRKNIYSCARNDNSIRDNEINTAIIGESIYSSSLARAIELEFGIGVSTIFSLEVSDEVKSAEDKTVINEDMTKEALKRYTRIIADPMYRPVCPDKAKFFSLPHEAYSGRCFRASIPDLINKKLKTD